MSASDTAITDFKASFSRALDKRGDKLGWSDGDRKAAKFYGQALTNKSDTVLPSIDSTLISEVNDAFVYGVVLNQRLLKPGTFNGERQPWFKRLFKAKNYKEKKRLGWRNKKIQAAKSSTSEDGVVELDEARQRLQSQFAS